MVNVEDSDFVRHSFRLLLQQATVLVGLGNLFYAVIFFFFGIETWYLNLLCIFLCIPILWLLALERPFPFSLLGIFLLAVFALSWPIYLTFTFGRDAGFHFPMFIILPIIVVSGRITRAVKWAMIIALAFLVIYLDGVGSAGLDNKLSNELARAFHFMNGMISIFALTGLVFFYFQIVTRQQDSLRTQAITDSLTGLFNRLYMQEIGSQAIVQCQRYKQPFSVLLCDLDKFKAINDKFGHQAGDEVLRRTSLMFKQYARESDSVGRWGGEEFLIFLPNTDKEGALRLANRIRKSISNYPIDIDGVLLSVTVSIGLSCLREGDTLDEVIARADMALYAAKDGGRDKVELG